MNLIKKNFIVLGIIFVTLIVVLALWQISNYKNKGNQKAPEINEGYFKGDDIYIENDIIYQYIVYSYADREDHVYKEKRGYIKENKNYIPMGEKVFVFSGDLGKLGFSSFNDGTELYYNNLSISTELRKPYNPDNVQAIDVLFECGKSLTEGKNYYCETNNKDFLSQYEYNNFSSAGFSTGAEADQIWEKIYVKKLDGNNFIFKGALDSGDFQSYEQVGSKQFLDELLESEKNQQKIKEWDEFIDSL